MINAFVKHLEEIWERSENEEGWWREKKKICFDSVCAEFFNLVDKYVQFAVPFAKCVCRRA